MNCSVLKILQMERKIVGLSVAISRPTALESSAHPNELYWPNSAIPVALVPTDTWAALGQIPELLFGPSPPLLYTTFSDASAML